MNLYWPVYKNIEEEVISIANIIHFSDDQLKVYSVRIADLIIRCAVEIESISKDLYKRILEDNSKAYGGDGRDLYFDTDCIKLINSEWHLNKKELRVSADNMYFGNLIINPLHKADKRGTSGAKWKQAYQALKHNRNNSLRKANIDNLLNALGALYLLNVYYADEMIDAAIPAVGYYNQEHIYKSKVFDTTSINACSIRWDEEVSDENIIWDEEDNDISTREKAIYIYKISEKDFIRIHKKWIIQKEMNARRFAESDLIKKFLEIYPDMKSEDMETICIRAAGEEFRDQVIQNNITSFDKFSLIQIVVNKSKDIYPHLSNIEQSEIDAEIENSSLY